MLTPAEINRRSALHGIMMALGASVVAGCGYMPGSSARASFSDAQLAVLESFADTMIPQTDTAGAVQAGVPKRLAKMYTDWASDDTRAELSGALDRLAESAQSNTRNTFSELSAEERLTLLQRHDKAALTPIEPKPGAPRGTFLSPIPSVLDVGYHKLKQLVLNLHYSSEVGLTSELVYEHVPGTWQPSIKVTPGMRPFASLGPF
ncbi:gluconate 2-dehydrogenase subunit 3 family protein [Sphingorhabdus sp.]|uniref:gluconate 2-dehydrogenase subunit 3 family protein n=1 Tax=Sphingorhabdus sp. TaxID=1902408 RepID=UPI00391B5A09